jgi:hypothetical protein
MSLPTNTFPTYDAIGNREDLADKIYRVEQMDTPFFSGIETGKATAINHEWQTQALRAAAQNAVVEGSDAITNARTATVRLGNYCQIADEVARVAGSQEAVDHAGRESELAYQEMLAGLELKRDIEYILVGLNTAKVAGDSGTARKTASLLSWVGTNDDVGATGASPTTLDGAATRGDGTQRAFTEARLKTVLQLIWASGGKPGTVMLGGFNKQVMSTFTGRGTPMEDTKSKKIVASVSAYESDFGQTLKVIANPQQRARDAWVLQMDMWKLCYLTGRKFVSKPLARTGDSERRQIITEFALEASNEKSSGLVADLTTS